MTNAELYEIVKDHRDVWEKCLSFRKSTWFPCPKAMCDFPIPAAIAENSLLGLGVAWLAKNGGSANIYPPMSGSDEYFVSSDMSACAGRPSMLAAVYAAIAEVKRG